MPLQKGHDLLKQSSPTLQFSHEATTSSLLRYSIVILGICVTFFAGANWLLQQLVLGAGLLDWFLNDLDEPVDGNEGSVLRLYLRSISNPYCRTGIDTTRPFQADKTIASQDKHHYPRNEHNIP
jgi:hypothetical protein